MGRLALLFVLSAFTCAAGADVLWDQLSAANNGFASQDFETAYNCYDCLAADDFGVPEPGWVIEAVEWDMVLYYGAEAPVYGIHIYIMPDRGDNLGDYDNPVYYEFAPVETIYNGTNTVTLATPVPLVPGHYFLGAAPALDFSSYSQCFFDTTTYAPVGQEMHMINPNGCFGMGSDWFQPSVGYDASFRLYGEIYDFGFPDAVIDLPVGDVLVYLGDYVEFAGTATDEDGEIVDWLWTFGEGSGIDDVHVEDPGLVQFNNVGVFEVTFNAQDNEGNWDPFPDKRTITVDPGYPDAVIDIPVEDVVVYRGDYVEFAGSATDENGELVDWLWTFGEGSGIDDMHVEDPGLVQFNDLGIFTVTFNAQDDDGNWDPEPDTRTVTVRGIVYVDQNASGPDHDGASWDTAFLTVQQGVDAAGGSGSGVWVADGAYVENVVMGEGVPAYGGFLGAEEGGYETQLDQRDWASNVAVIDGNQSGSCVIVAADSRLDGFTVTNGCGTPGDHGYKYGGGIYCNDPGASVVITNCDISGNLGADDCIGGGICCYGSSPLIVNCVISGNSAGYAGGVLLLEWSALITNNTICGNSAEFQGGGIYCTWWCEPSISNNIVAANTAAAGGGIFNEGQPALSHNDFWGNWPQDYCGCEPGDGDISEDPRFVDYEGGDFHLNHGSPCIDAGSNDAPGLPEYDFEGDPRIMDGDGDEIFIVDIGADEHPADECVFTEAPDPEPYCEGALFGEPAAGYPGWVWFSIPLDPAECCGGADCYDPTVLLGFSCSGRLWYWDKYGKWANVYRPPFLKWELSAGDSYLLYLDSAVENPAYEGVDTEMPFEFRLGRQGWTWVGMPGLEELGYPDFMSQVQVEYPVGGEIRTAGEDYSETPNNWVSWGWSFWDTYRQAPETFTPYAEFGCNTCYPWVGYRVWVNVGAAVDEDDPDQVTLMWRKSQ